MQVSLSDEVIIDVSALTYNTTYQIYLPGACHNRVISSDPFSMYVRTKMVFPFYSWSSVLHTDKQKCPW